MTIEIGMLFAGIAAIIGAATFLLGRQSAAKKDGQEWGSFTSEIRSDIRYIKNDLDELKAQNKVIGSQYADIRTDVAVVKRDLKTAFNLIDGLKLPEHYHSEG